MLNITVEALSNATFRVKLEPNHELTVRASGKVRRVRMTRILAGDSVEIDYLRTVRRCDPSSGVAASRSHAGHMLRIAPGIAGRAYTLDLEYVVDHAVAGAFPQFTHNASNGLLGILRYLNILDGVARDTHDVVMVLRKPLRQLVTRDARRIMSLSKDACFLQNRKGSIQR